MATAQFRLRIYQGEAVAIGPGKVDLLQAVADTGSISAAARRLGMSYRRAWLLIDEMNRLLKSPVVETAQGGVRGGGAVLSATGEEIIRRYKAIEEASHTASGKDLRALMRLIAG